jgi:hypothetical protein
MGYDGKYGRVTTEHGDIPDDEPVIVFRGRDRLVPEMLAHYMDLCERAGSPARHVRLVHVSTDLIEKWQRDNPDRVRTPDSERSREWMDS